MKKLNLILRKCKSLSRQLSRSSSYSSLRSKSTRDHHDHDHHHHHHQHEIFWGDHAMQGDGDEKLETIFVGSTRKRYLIKSKYLNHPLLTALIRRSKQNNGDDQQHVIMVKCEVVLFDHLLWMLENNDQNVLLDSLDELADLYLL